MARKITRLAILLLTLSQIAANCDQPGTETGNPGTPGTTPTCKQSAAAASDQVVDDLIESLCQRIIKCGVVTTTDTCVNALEGAAGDRMTDQFGLTPAGQYTITQLRSGLMNGTITTMNTNLSNCENDIPLISCVTVTSDVSGSSFLGVENIVPTSCLSTFGTISVSSSGPNSGNCP